MALGHNQQIAWGFTIFGLDQQDLYIEELNPSNALQYKTAQGWKTMQVLKETFAVRGAPSESVELKFTQHGPVLWQDWKPRAGAALGGRGAGDSGVFGVAGN